METIIVVIVITFPWYLTLFCRYFSHIFIHTFFISFFWRPTTQHDEKKAKKNKAGKSKNKNEEIIEKRRK